MIQKFVYTMKMLKIQKDLILKVIYLEVGMVLIKLLKVI